LSSLTLIALIFGYSSQIFADFCGYSLIALGVAKLFGYHLPINFNFPYISKSFSEFWSRWHISLSKFLRDYLYIPLGGNRISQFRTYINIMVTIILGGLWHGAAWSYVLWGFFHGMALALERPFRNRIVSNVAMNIIRIATVYILVSLAWLFFKLPDVSHVILYFKAIRNNFSVPHNFGYIIPILIFSIPVWGYHILYLWNTSRGMMPRMVVDFLYAVMLFLIIFERGSLTSFVYFRF
jgi:alginate O-acetyltransferase complex protein AlgI